MDRVGDQNPLWNIPLKPSTEEKKTRKKEGSEKVGSFSQALEAEEEKKAWEAAGLGTFAPGTVNDEVLGQLLDRVKESGDSLVKNPSPGAMRQYKKHITELIQALIAGSLEVTEVHGRLKPSTGTRPKYTQIQVVNEKLDKLGAFILQDQKDKLEILRRVEELKGLLINLLS